jgi:hypothetical protein
MVDTVGTVGTVGGRRKDAQALESEQCGVCVGL